MRALRRDRQEARFPAIRIPNAGTEREHRERLTPRKVIGYTKIEATLPPDFNINRDIPRNGHQPINLEIFRSMTILLMQ